MARTSEPGFGPRADEDPAAIPESDDAIGGDRSDDDRSDDDISYQYEDPNDDR